MKTEKITKKTVAKKSTTKAKVVEVFASVAEETPDKKRVAKKAAVKSVVETPSVKKAVRDPSKPLLLDPFAEIAIPAAQIAASPVKKAATKAVKKPVKKKTTELDAELPPTEAKVKVSPVFKALADVSLPELERDNRARLLMQTPTRVYFYWSIKENPWATLRNVFGDDLGNYSLVVKLIDKKHNFEKVSQCEAEGNWWFDVEPDSEYQAEIGFYAPARPYFRIVYSNIVETPRRSPSPRAATEAKWTVSANKFAEVLDVAGFSRDAFDVAMAGDDHAASENASQIAFSKFLGTDEYDLGAITAEDIRYAMLALASGVKLEDLRHKISAALFAILESNVAAIESGKAMAALTEYFDIDEAEFVEEQVGSGVFGASRVSFPKTLKTKGLSPKSPPRYNPVSSHSLR